MQLGMIGLGRMGANMVRRLMRAEHTCVVFDRSQEAIDRLVEEGAVGASSVEELAKKLDAPRAVWLMVPAGAGDFVDEGGANIPIPPVGRHFVSPIERGVDGRFRPHLHQRLEDILSAADLVHPVVD